MVYHVIANPASESDISGSPGERRRGLIRFCQNDQYTSLATKVSVT
jgi:hypothetical protein